MMSAPAPPDDGSNSNSGSDSSDAEEENPTTSTLPEIPVNETTPDSLPQQQQSTATSFNGGRNHYVQSMNKKAKTHRHHKRRNRHQTLRSSAK
jgi:hypothetical protein